MTLWDVCDQKPKFVHGGHLQKVNDIAIHPNLTDVFASVDNDNAIHVFQPNKNYKWWLIVFRFIFYRIECGIYYTIKINLNTNLSK